MLFYSLILFFMLMAKNGAFATETFVTFQQKYGKVYQSDSELSFREEIFKENLAKIEEHNKQFQQNLVSYELGLNQFSDLTQAEFQALLTMSPLNDQLTKQMEKYNSSEFDIKAAPDSVNWVKNGVVTPVKNQGNCGSCWAFTTTGAVESRLAIKTGSLVSLSEQQLLDCNSINKACEGGNLAYALKYVERAGLTTEAEYPYKGSSGTCNSTKPVAAYTKGYTFIASGLESDLLKAVAAGPVAVALNADLLQYYSSGILYSSVCSNVVNHGGLVVGYEQNDTTIIPYWIIKNSWGPQWGENGYFRMAMGYNLCGITSQPIYPTKVSNTTIADDSDGGAAFMYQNFVTCLLGLIACFLFFNLFG